MQGEEEGKIHEDVEMETQKDEGGKYMKMKEGNT